MPDQVSVNNPMYILVKDFQSSYQVLVSGLVRDALTGEAPTGTISITLEPEEPTKVTATDQIRQSLIFIKVLSSGLFCLAGEPGRIFPYLSNTDYKLVLLVQVPGYVDNTQPVSIPKNSIFPMLTLPPLDMQRQPVRIQGRVVGMTTIPTYIEGASILLLDEPNPPTPLTEHVIALRTPLYSPHDTGTKVQQRQLTPSNTARKLTTSAARGTQVLILDNSTGLATNDVLLIGSDPVCEYVVIDNVLQNMPGQVHVLNALNYSFAAGTAVMQYVPDVIGATTTLTRSTDAGNGGIYLADILPAAPADVIEIAYDTAALVEYHALGAVTDANGYYRLDGITQVQTVYMEASSPKFAAMQAPTTWTVDYGQPVNSVDFRLLPQANP